MNMIFVGIGQLLRISSYLYAKFCLKATLTNSSLKEAANVAHSLHAQTYNGGCLGRYILPVSQQTIARIFENISRKRPIH